MAATATLKHYKDGMKNPLQRSYTEVYRVEAASGTQNAAEILVASGLPAVSGMYVGDSGAIVSDYKAKRIDLEGTEWEVDVTYTWSWNQTNNWYTGTRYQYGGELAEEVARSGWSGSGTGVTPCAIKNSFGDPFNPPLMRTFTVLLIKATWTGDSTAASTIRGFILSLLNTVNNAAITVDGVSYPAGTLLLRSINPQVNGSQMSAEFEFAYKSDTWVQRVLDAGTRFFASPGMLPAIPASYGLGQREVRRCDVETDIKYGTPKDKALGEPVMLNGSGTLVGNAWPYDPTQTPVYLNFWVNGWASWTGLSTYL